MSICFSFVRRYTYSVKESTNRLNSLITPDACSDDVSSALRKSSTKMPQDINKVPNGGMHVGFASSSLPCALRTRT